VTRSTEGRARGQLNPGVDLAKPTGTSTCFAPSTEHRGHGRGLCPLGAGCRTCRMSGALPPPPIFHAPCASLLVISCYCCCIALSFKNQVGDLCLCRCALWTIDYRLSTMDYRLWRRASRLPPSPQVFRTALRQYQYRQKQAAPGPRPGPGQQPTGPVPANQAQAPYPGPKRKTCAQRALPATSQTTVPDGRWPMACCASPAPAPRPGPGPLAPAPALARPPATSHRIS
jgi:hypothetical protein